jgi:hypothetical protein
VQVLVLRHDDRLKRTPSQEFEYGQALSPMRKSGTDKQPQRRPMDVKAPPQPPYKYYVEL